MKRNFYILLSACVGLILTSCMDDDTPISYEVSKDAQIYDFSVSNDSIEGLGDVKFSIDQIAGLIYNRDSLPFGTKVGDVICSITTKSASKIDVKETYPADTTFSWKAEDSVNFTKPVVFEVFAADQSISKSYKAFINVHQINPDSMFWDKVAEDVFGSVVNGQKTVKISEGVYYSYVRSGSEVSVYKTQKGDMSVWAQQSLTGFPSTEAVMESITRFGGQFVVKTDKGALYVSNDGIDWNNTNAPYTIASVLGAYTPGQATKPVLSLIINKGNQYFYAATSDLSTYKVGGTVVAGFPINGFGSYTYTSFYNERLMLAGGKDVNNETISAVWSSMTDGTDWALTSANASAAFGRKEGVAVTQYGNNIYLVGGITASGDASNEIYTSVDFGYSWNLVDTIIDLPASYKARGYIDATTVGEKLYLIGGRDNSTWFNQVWSGFLLKAAEEIRANNK